MNWWPVLVVLLCACSDEDSTPIPWNPPPEPKIISYLALGDSYTIGQSVAESERWPVILSAYLKGAGFSTSPRIIAKTGWTSSNLAKAMQNELKASDTFDLVSLLIGVNNQYQGLALEQYKNEFAALLQEAIRLTGGRKEKVFVVSIPDYGFTPFGLSAQVLISQQIDQFNAAARELSMNAGVAYYNITDISRQGIADPELVASDQLHPSGKQYARWVERFREQVLGQVKQ